MEALEFSCIYTCVQPATGDVFLVIANMHTESIQKQIVEYNTKSKYPEEYLPIDTPGNEKPLAGKTYFMQN